MNKQDIQRSKLKEQLDKVNHRLEILSTIESKLLKMRQLAQRVVLKNLTDEEIQDIDKRIQKLLIEVDFLNSEATKQS